ncbi:MAG TPA: arginase family protein [Candidatus Udaeobacter sp.]|jgi:arginase|nr:arginase family protein [Candidatus Udaeobacter sp.]
MDTRLLLVPYDSGQRSVRMGAGPEHLLNSGLKEHLAKQSHAADAMVVEPTAQNWRAEVQTSFELMRAIAKSVRESRAAYRFPVVLSGNCNACIGVIAALGSRTGIVWLDAHGDFNTPQTTMSGFLDGMSLATATGRCWAELARSIEGFEPVPEQTVVLLGARDLDPGEETALARSKIVRLSVQATALGVESVLQSLGREISRCYLHLDLDALDPTEGRANNYSARGGYSRADLQCVLATIARDLPVKALTVSGYDPSFDKDGAVRDAAFDAIATVLGTVEKR